MLRDQIRKKLIHDILPRQEPIRTWAGPGLGQRCAACERPIPGTEVEYEVQFEDGIDTFRFHRDCHAVWQAERLAGR